MKHKKFTNFQLISIFILFSNLLFSENNSFQVGDTVFTVDKNPQSELVFDDQSNFYFVDRNDSLHAYEQTGEKRWATRITSKLYMSPLVFKNHILVPIREGIEIYSFDGNYSKTINTSHTISQIYSWSDSLLICILGTNIVQVLNFDGDILEEYNIDYDINPILNADKSFYTASSNEVRRIDNTGKEAWSKSFGFRSIEKIMAGNNQELYFIQNGILYAFSFKGRSLWKYKINSEVRQMVINEDGDIIMAKRNAEIDCLSKRGKLRWRKKLPSTLNSDDIIITKNNSIFLYASNGIVYTLLNSGEIVASVDIGSNYFYPVISPSGTVLFSNSWEGILALDMNYEGLANSSFPCSQRNYYGSKFWISEYSGPIEILEQPVDTSFCEGSDYILDFRIKGERPIDIEWIKDDISIFHSDFYNLTLTNTSKELTGSHEFIVNNSKGGDRTEPIQIQVNEHPSKPTITNLSGDFSVSNLDESTYDWYSLQEEEPIEENTSEFSSPDDAAYYCAATNNFGCSSFSNIIYQYSSIPSSIKTYTNSEINNSIAIDKDNNIYYLDYSKLVKSSEFGDTIWTYSLNEDYVGPVLIHPNGNVVISFRDEVCMISSEGKLIWNQKLNNHSSEMAIGKNGDIIATGGENIISLNSDGVKRWEIDFNDQITLKLIDPSGNIHLVGDEYSIVSSEGVLIKSINLYANYSGITNSGILILGVSGGLKAYDSDYNFIWKLALPSSISCPIVVDENNIIYTMVDEFLYAIRPNGKILWKVNAEIYSSAKPILGADNRIYLFSYNGYAYCFDLNGTKIWEEKLTEGFHSEPYLTQNGALFFVDNNRLLQGIYINCLGETNSSLSSTKINNQNTRFNFEKYTGKIKIVSNPSDTSFCEGEDILINLDVSGEYPMQFIWYKENQFLFEKNNTSLKFDHCQIKNSGNYFCIIKNRHGIDTINAFQIEIIETPKKPIISFENDVLSLLNSDGSTWFRNDTMLVTHAFQITNPVNGYYYAVNESENGCPSESSLFNVNKGEDILWKVDFENSFYNSNPIAVDDNNLIYYCNNDQVFVLAIDGRIVNTISVNEDIRSRPYIWRNNLLVITESSLKQYNIKGGLNWSLDYSISNYQLAVSEQGNICFATDDNLIVLDSLGNILWQKEGETSSICPVIDGEGNIYTYLNYKLTSFDLKGNIRWNLAGVGAANSLAISPNGTIIIPSGSSLFAASLDGKLLWNYNTGANFSNPVIDDDGRIYTTSDGFILSFTPAGELIFKLNKYQEFNHPVNNNKLLISKDQLYFSSSDYYGGIVKINKYNGEVLPFNNERSYLNICLAVDGTLIAQNHSTVSAIGNNNSPLSQNAWGIPQGNSKNTGQFYVGNSKTPTIVHKINDTILCAGSNYIPPINYSGTYPIQIEWFRNGEILSFEQGYNNLYIENASIDNEGEYYYKLSNNYGVTTSSVFTIHVDEVKEPKIERNQNELSVLNASNKFQWYRNDTLLSTSLHAFAPEAYGNHYVVNLSQNGCKTKSNSINFYAFGEHLWSRSWTADLNQSVAVSDDGTLYFTDNEYLYAYNNDFSKKWKSLLGGMNYHAPSPVIGQDGTVFCARSDYFGKAVIARNKLGNKIWYHPFGKYLRGDLAMGADNNIYVFDINKKIYSLNGFDGSLEWRYSLNSYVETAPAIASDGNIYIPTINNKLVALSVNGKLLWEYTTGDDVLSTPAIGSENEIYFGSNDKFFYCLNKEGELIWKQELNGKCCSPVINEEGTIYITSRNMLYAINKTGSIEWQFEIAYVDELFAPVIDAEGYVYVFDTQKRLCAINSNGVAEHVGPEQNIVLPSAMTLANDGTLFLKSHSSNHDYYAVHAYSTKGNKISDSIWPAKSQGNHNRSLSINTKNATSPLIVNKDDFTDMQLNKGDSISFVINSTGSQPLLYSIYKEDALIVQSKMNSLTFNPTNIDDSGTYYFVVSNRAGKDSIQQFSLTINDTDDVLPHIAEVIDNQEACVDNDFSLNVNVDGYRPITTNWYCNNTLITTTNNPILNINDISTNRAGEYYCIVSNFFGSDTSNVFQLNVLPNPIAPVLKEQGDLILSTYESGNKWYFEGNYIENEGQNSFSPKSNGKYFVEIVKDGCTSRSNTINFTIKDEPKLSVGIDIDYDIEELEIFPALSNEGKIYIPALHNLVAFSVYGGSDWIKSGKGKHFGTPVLNNNDEIFSLHKPTGNILSAIDLSGETIWEKELNEELGLVPAIGAGNQLIIPLKKGIIKSFDRWGNEKWNYEISDSIEGTVSISSEGNIHFGANDGCLYALNRDGIFLWKFQTDAAINTSPAIDNEGTVYFGGMYGVFYAVDLNGTLKWKYTTRGGNFRHPVLDADGNVYVTNTDDWLYSINKNGVLNWKKESNEYPTPIVGNDEVIYAALSNGRISAFKQDGTFIESLRSSNNTYPRNTQFLMMGTGGHLFYYGNDGGSLAQVICSSTGLSNSAWPKLYKNNANTNSSYIEEEGEPPVVSKLFNDTTFCDVQELNLANTFARGTYDILKWFKDNVEISNDSNLVISDLKIGDSGVYYCVAYNNNGYTESNHFYLEVINCSTDPDLYKEPVEIAYTNEAIKLDGIENGLWDQVEAIHLEREYVNNTPTISAYWKGLWADNGFYFLVAVEDDDHYPFWETNSSSSVETDFDNVQVFLDINQNKEDGYGCNDYYNIGHYYSYSQMDKKNNGVSMINQYSRTHHPGGTSCYRTNGENYVAEFYIPYSNMKNSDDLAMNKERIIELANIGFDVVVVDQDEGRTTEPQRLVWKTDGKNGRGFAYDNMDSCGIIRLVESIDFCKPSWLVQETGTMVNLNGSITDNFEKVSDANIIGAFVGEECRGFGSVFHLNDSSYFNFD
ncbi:MAG: PQQ-binding-like beta-propeller repeat protein, partial [Prolixibacteraceae bacterium]|nr:PQQ-binding-like beta-propeller repeat protein [Prolixibacteraceae bacterium]